MPIIETITPEAATGELAKLYKIITAMRGNVGHNARIFSVSSELLRQQIDFIRFYSEHPTLSMPLLAAIRIMVSSDEACQFCIDFNTALLINYAGWSMEQVTAMRSNIDDANLNERDLSMLRLAVKAVRDAHTVNANDLDMLREMGWHDSDMLEAVNHAARMLATDVVFNTFKIESFR